MSEVCSAIFSPITTSRPSLPKMWSMSIPIPKAPASSANFIWSRTFALSPYGLTILTVFAITS